MGRISIGWIVVCVMSPDCFSRKLEYTNFVRRLGDATATGGGESGPYNDFASNTLEFALQLRKNYPKTPVRVT